MTTESYSNNISLLKNRWPDLAKAIDEHDINHVEFELVERQCATLSVNGIQLSSAYDPVECAVIIFFLQDTFFQADKLLRNP